MRGLNYKQKEYNWILNVMRRQKELLGNKDTQLLDLYHFCDNDDERTLLADLLIRFNCFDSDLYNAALQDMVKYICGLNYKEDEMALVASCHDLAADSSQVVLDDIKVPMAQAGYSKVKTINRFDKILREYNKSGKLIKHFIAVDEFIGSGKTLSLRLDEFNRFGLSGVTIDFVFLAGMQDAIMAGRTVGASLFAVYEMEKGLSGYYSGEQLELRVNQMKSLEEKLAPMINRTVLDDYRFGYHGTEALYCRPDRNVPNNVFPVFWWKADKNGYKRNTLLTRVQDGY